MISDHDRLLKIDECEQLMANTFMIYKPTWQLITKALSWSMEKTSAEIIVRIGICRYKQGHAKLKLMKNNWQLIIDVEKCEDCNNCFLACKDEHVDNEWPGYSLPQPLHGHRWMNIMRKERGQFPMIDVAYLPIPCMHCDRAPCIEAAKGGAVYKRDDGIVIIDPEKARG